MAINVSSSRIESSMNRMLPSFFSLVHSVEPFQDYFCYLLLNSFSIIHTLHVLQIQTKIYKNKSNFQN